MTRDARPEDQLAVIVVHASADGRLAADRVDVNVRIEGASLVTGDAALAKARELRALVQSLAAVGLSEEALSLTAIRAKTHDGFLTKSSSATYDLRVDVPNLDLLADVVGIITSQPNTSITGMKWRFERMAEYQAELLRDAMKDARRRAEGIAAGLGVVVGQVRRVQEASETPNTDIFSAAGIIPQAKGGSRARVSAAELGMAVTHETAVKVRATVTFAIAADGVS